jgi:hypothetical protein
MVNESGEMGMGNERIGKMDFRTGQEGELFLFARLRGNAGVGVRRGFEQGSQGPNGGLGREPLPLWQQRVRTCSVPSIPSPFHPSAPAHEATRNGGLRKPDPQQNSRRLPLPRCVRLAGLRVCGFPGNLRTVWQLPATLLGIRARFAQRCRSPRHHPNDWPARSLRTSER